MNHGAAKALFAFPGAAHAYLVILDLVILIHKKFVVRKADAVKIFGDIHLIVHVSSSLVRKSKTYYNNIIYHTSESRRGQIHVGRFI